MASSLSNSPMKNNFLKPNMKQIKNKANPKPKTTSISFGKQTLVGT